MLGTGRRFAVVALASWLLLSSAGATIRPRYGGTLLWGVVADVGEIDPLVASSPIERHIARQVFAGLYHFDADGEPVPDLVERVEVLEGGDVKLTLRPASFHDGRRVSAEDVRASLERFAASPTVGAALAAAEGGFVRVTGDREVVLRVGAVPVLWPWLLADVRAGIVPADGGRGIGCGPFRIARRAPESLMLDGWDLHHRGRPLFDGLELRRFPDERALVLGHRHQGVDVAEVAAAPAGAGARGAGVELVMLRLNALDPRLHTIASRTALVRAVGRDALVEVVLGGQAEKRTGLLPIRAREAVARAAAADAREPSPETQGEVRLTYPAGRDLRAVAERIRVDLHAHGIEARLVELPTPAFRAAMAGADYQLLLLPLVITEASSGLMLADIAASARLPLPPELRRALASVDPWRQTQELAAAETALLADVVLYPLFRRQRSLLVRDSVRDLEVDPGGCAVLEESWRWPILSGADRPFP